VATLKLEAGRVQRAGFLFGNVNGKSNIAVVTQPGVMTTV
jgi:hypothetical protein